MAKAGIKIIADKPGTGPELKRGDRVRVKYNIQLTGGDVVAKNRDEIWTIGDRNAVAGFRYGLEGMRDGGARRFKASPHLCYRDLDMANIPKNAVLIFNIKRVEIVG